MPGGIGRRHAVVIGASIAGLCAARVLSDFYDRVTVFERDELPGAPANRGAVPQDRHVHLLMARGAVEFDALFPGLLDDMVASGVPKLENRPVRRRGGTSRWATCSINSWAPQKPILFSPNGFYAGFRCWTAST